MEGKDIIVFTMDGCPACEYLKKNAKKKLKFCNISRDAECLEKAYSLGLDRMPSVVVYKDGKPKIAEIKDKDGKLIAEVDGEEFEL